jgi:NADPH-dependent glutamate synthase beta subunit-like oxidoreductase
VVEIHGKERLCGVTIARVDENRRPIKESEEYIPCDTLLLSCGLIPENELTKGAGIALDRVTSGAVVNGERETEIPGIFACGNVLHVHDLVDYVSEESAIAGRAAAKFIRGEGKKEISVNIKTDGRVRYTVPQKLTEIANTSVYFRVADVYRDAKIVVRDGENIIISKKTQKLAPAEMEKVELKAEVISTLSGGELSFAIEF